MLYDFFMHYAAKQRIERGRGCYDRGIIAALFLELTDEHDHNESRLFNS